MLTEEQQEQQERRPWQLHHKKSTSSGQCFFQPAFIQLFLNGMIIILIDTKIDV
jgi:hypothetical protein